MRKTVVISASIASVMIDACILGVVAIAAYTPIRQHLEIEIKPKAACDTSPCGALGR